MSFFKFSLNKVILIIITSFIYGCSQQIITDKNGKEINNQSGNYFCSDGILYRSVDRGAITVYDVDRLPKLCERKDK